MPLLLLLWVQAATGEALPVVSVALPAEGWPSSPGYHVIHTTAEVGGRKMPLAYGVFLPPVYFTSHQPLPILVALHNGGSKGADGGTGLTYEGMGMLLSQDHPDDRGAGEKPANPVHLRREAQFIGLVPQCPEGCEWDTPPVPRLIDALIGQIAKAYGADETRVYLTGFSYGATFTWRMALALPHRFAAIVPVDGRATPDPARDALKLQDVAIYQVIGSDDAGFLPEAQRMRTALEAAKHPKYIYHVIQGGTHWSYAAVYTDPAFWTWLLAQHRGAVTWVPRTAGAAPAIGGATRVTAVTAVAPKGGSVLCQYWRDLPGTHLKDLVADPAFPRFPDEQVYLDQMEVPPDQAPNFGTVLRGWLRPPQTGDYIFGIASDGPSELWLSRDDQPEHAAPIAQVSQWVLPRNWRQDPQQRSQPVRLEAGRRYYVEARQKKGGGGDSHLAVAWEWPDGTVEGPIAGAHLTPAPALALPPLDVKLASPPSWPSRAGSYDLQMQVEGQAQHATVAVRLVLPRGYGSDATRQGWGTRLGAGRIGVLVACAVLVPLLAIGLPLRRKVQGSASSRAWWVVGSADRVVLTVAVAAAALLVLPRGDNPEVMPPVLVSFADSAVPPPDAAVGGGRGTGPAEVLAGALGAWSPLVVICPRCPGDGVWDHLALRQQRVIAAVVDKLLHDLPTDGRRVYVTGAGDGGGEVWKLTLMLPQRWAAAAAVGTTQVQDARLPVALRGTAVRLVTGVRDGAATECANRMKDALAQLTPPPQMVYEMQMGSEAAGAHYARRDFYAWLLNRWRLGSGSAPRPWFDAWSDPDQRAHFASRWLAGGEEVRLMCAGVIQGRAALLYRHYLVVTNRRVILWHRAAGHEDIVGLSGQDLSHGTVGVVWRGDQRVEFSASDGRGPDVGFRFFQEQGAAAARLAVQDLLRRYGGP
jgi:predicted peptidase